MVLNLNIPDVAEDTMTSSQPARAPSRAERPPSAASSASPTHKENTPVKREKDKDREEKVRQLRERQDAERKQRLEELRESQRLAEEFRLKQQELKKQKLEEMKKKEDERRAAVDERRRIREALERNKREAILQKTSERLARYEHWKLSARPKGAVTPLGFGSSTPRNLWIAWGSSPRSQSQGRVGRRSPDSENMRPARRALSASSGVRKHCCLHITQHQQQAQRLAKQTAAGDNKGVNDTPPRSARQTTFDRLSTPKQRDKVEFKNDNTPAKGVVNFVASPKTPTRYSTPPRKTTTPRPGTSKESPAPDRDKKQRVVRTIPKDSIMSKSMHEMASPKDEKAASDIMSKSTTDLAAKSLQDITEEEYKAKIAEKRKEAREKALRESELLRQKEEEERLAEEERIRKEEEEQKRMEEEAERLATELREAEEERLKLAIEAEQERQRQEAEKLEAEKLLREETERKNKEENERLEREREKLAKHEEEERLERKKKLEMIMKRVKTDSPVPTEGSKMSDSIIKVQTSPSRTLLSVDHGSSPLTVEDDAASSDGILDDDSADERRSEDYKDSTSEKDTPVQSDSESRSKFRSPLLQQLYDKRTGNEEPRKFKSPLLQNMLGGRVGEYLKSSTSSEKLNKISPSSSSDGFEYEPEKNDETTIVGTEIDNGNDSQVNASDVKLDDTEDSDKDKVSIAFTSSDNESTNMAYKDDDMLTNDENVNSIEDNLNVNKDKVSLEASGDMKSNETPDLIKSLKGANTSDDGSAIETDETRDSDAPTEYWLGSHKGGGDTLDLSASSFENIDEAEDPMDVIHSTENPNLVSLSDNEVVNNVDDVNSSSKEIQGSLDRDNNEINGIQTDSAKDTLLIEKDELNLLTNDDINLDKNDDINSDSFEVEHDNVLQGPSDNSVNIMDGNTNGEFSETSPVNKTQTDEFFNNFDLEKQNFDYGEQHFENHVENNSFDEQQNFASFSQSNKNFDDFLISKDPSKEFSQFDSIENSSSKYTENSSDIFENSNELDIRHDTLKYPASSKMEISMDSNLDSSPSDEGSNNNVLIDITHLRKSESQDTVIRETFPSTAWPEISSQEIGGEMTSGESSVSSPGDISHTLVDSTISMKSTDDQSPTTEEVSYTQDTQYYDEDVESTPVINTKTHHLNNLTQFMTQTDGDLLNYNNLSNTPDVTDLPPNLAFRMFEHNTLHPQEDIAS